MGAVQHFALDAPLDSNVVVVAVVVVVLQQKLQAPDCSVGSVPSTDPGSGPPLSRSNTWLGLTMRRKLVMSSRPWQPPDLTLTKNNTGRTPGGMSSGDSDGRIITETGPPA